MDINLAEQALNAVISSEKNYQNRISPIRYCNEKLF